MSEAAAANVVPFRDPEELEYQREMQARRWEARVRSAGIPPKWQGVTWAELDCGETPGRRAAVQALRGWAEGRIPGLLLSGPVGIGKTRMAATAARAALGHRPVLWLPLAEVFRHLSFGFGTPERDRAMKRLEARPGSAVVLDDLDKARPSEYAAEVVYSAINGWVEAEAPLLVTMNETLEGIEERYPSAYGTAIASRLAEACEVYEIQGRDRRVEP